MKKSAVLLLFALLALCLRTQAAVVYVNGSYTGSIENGSSWATPYKNLLVAINAAAPGDEIWVAKGTYTTPANTNLQGFHIKKDVSIFGGFEGVETSIFSRDLGINKTVCRGFNNDRIFSLNGDVRLSLDGLNLTGFSTAIIEHYDTLTSQPDVALGQRFYLDINNCNFYGGSTPIKFGFYLDLNISNSTFDGSGGMQTIYFDTDLVPSDTKQDWNEINLTNVVVRNYSNPFLVGLKYGLEVTSSTFTSCSVELFINGQNLGLKDFNFTNCVFESMSGRVTGGGGNSFGIARKVKYDGCVFNNNSASPMILSQDGNNKTTITHCRFLNNVSSNSFVYIQANLFNELNIDQSLFSNNTGKLIFSDAGIIKIANTKFDNNTFSNPNNNGDGLLMFSPGQADDLGTVLDHVEFTNNKISGGNSSGIFSVGKILTLTACNISHNDIGNATVYTTSDIVQVDDCIFEGNNNRNQTTLAIYGNSSSSPSFVRNSLFKNNQGVNTGALRLTSSTNVSNCRFIGNTTTQSGGGAIGCFGGEVKITDSYFEGNSNGGWGGGAIGSWVFTAIDRCYFKNNVNSGENHGGGALTATFGYFHVSNTTFEGNRATQGAGGAVLLFTGSQGAPPISEFKNCTFIKNYATYGSSTFRRGEVISGQPKIFSNCILWGNGPKPSGLLDPSGTIVKHCNIQAESFPGTGNTSLDPKFVDFNGGNYRLSCASPLINKGDNEFASSDQDLDKAPRIFGVQVDLGAYEFPQDPATATLPPVVSFNIPTSACRLESVTFANLSPSDGIRFEWNFGDGDFAQVSNPEHTYQTPGTYTVSLTATNACGASAQLSKTITITPTFAPTISFNTLVCPGQTTTFTTDVNCPSLAWSVEGGTLLSGNGTQSISVLWGTGAAGNGKVTLLATGCGSGFCETPVSITVPIVPVNFTLQGPNALCQGASATYETTVKNSTPSTIYTWTAKGGTISGTSSAYNLHQVDVNWGTTDTLGVIYLTTFNELLRCGRTDSIRVKLRPRFAITGQDKACAGGLANYFLNPFIPSTTYTWTVSGSGNSISNGAATWGSTTGAYQVIAEINESNKACNVRDTFDVTLLSRPVVLGITGETEVLPNAVQSYVANVDISTGIQYQWSITGGYVGGMYQNQANVVWNATGPYQISLTAVLTEGSCASAPFVLPIGNEFVYTISGPDTICISTTGNFTINEDPNFTNTFDWSSSIPNQGTASGNTYELLGTLPGIHTIKVIATRNNKTYTVFKTVFVKSALTDIALSGPIDIDPQGTGTYTYQVRNSLNLVYNYSVVGAASHSRSGNDITVTWGGAEPFSITAVGLVAGNTCTGVPAVFNVRKAGPLSTIINSIGSPCVNSRVRYTYVTDNLTTNIQWAISSGGTIIANSANEITVEWASTGNHSVTIQYERFGTKTISLPVNVKPLPTPVINDALVCGSNPLLISTATSYSAYKWFVEPNAISFSSAAQATINAEGQYRVEVTDANGCVAFGSRYIEQIPLPRVKVFSEQEFGYCQQNGGPTLPIQLKTYQGQDYQYQWFANGSPVGTNSPVLSRTVNTAQLSTTSYSVRVTLLTCSQTSAPALVNVYTCPSGGTTCGSAPVSFTTSVGCPPYTFANTSSGSTLPGALFGWTFGDGTSSSLVNPPPKSYSDVGIYSVYLMRGCAAALTKVKMPGIALFKLDAPGCKGQALTFNELSVNYPIDNPITAWQWNFGDGTQVQDFSGNGNRDVTHTFANEGTFPVTLTIYTTDQATNAVCAHSITKNIVVTTPPVADFIVSPPPCTDNTYKFIDNSTFFYSKAKYLWNFGNGNTSTLIDPSQKLAPGTQTISLQVTDLFGCTGSVSKSQLVLTPNVVGKIVLTGDTTLCNGRSVTLTSPPGSSYVWRKDGNILPQTSQSIVVSTAGSYAVTYSVPGCNVSTLPVVLKDFTLPNLVSGNPKGCVGEPITINTNLDPAKYSFTWKFNGIDLPSVQATLTVNNAQLTNAGNYVATVTDKKNGCVLSLPSFAITMYNKPAKPTILATQPVACYNGSVTLGVPIPSTGNTFAWYKDQQVLVGKVDSSLVLPNIKTSNTYSLTLTENSTGCSINADPINIGVASQIVAKVTGDKLACEYTSISFGLGLSPADYSVQWYKNGIVNGVDNTTYSFSNVLLSDAGAYHAVVTSKGTNNVLGCQSTSDTLTLVIKAGPVLPSITGPTTFCTGSPITLTTNLISNFRWNTGAITSNLPVSLGGTYTVTSRNPISGCENSASLSVMQNPLPDLSFFPTGIYEICASDRVTFIGLETYPTYAWYVNGILFNTTNKMYPTKSGKYTLSVTTDKGCTAVSDTLRFTSLRCPCLVTNINNAGLGSLREAIDCSNAKTGKDFIDFAIPGNGPHVIFPTTALPTIIDSVVIDGFTQSGLGNYDIVIDGSAFSSKGFVLGLNHSNTEIKGLTFRKFVDAIEFSSFTNAVSLDSNQFIDNTSAAVMLNTGAYGNTISENSMVNSGKAVVLVGSCHDNTIARNTITTSEVGVMLGNGSDRNTIVRNDIANNTQHGIWINAGSNENVLKANTIGGHAQHGILIANSDSNTLDSNYIGVRVSGVAIPNQSNGVTVRGTSNANVIHNNVIGANVLHGIQSGGVNSPLTVVQTIANNFIGLTRTGNPIGNGQYGVYTVNGRVNAFGNQIANHGQYGMRVVFNANVQDNTFRQNALGGIEVVNNLNSFSRNIFTNTNAAVKAIDLHFTSLPAGNNGKLPATFTKYRRADNGGIILKGTSLAGDTVEVFKNDNRLQQALVFSGVAIANASGVWELEIPVGTSFDPNQKNYYVNTASNAGNTSELSVPYLTGCFTCVCLVTNTNDAGAGSLRGELDNANTGGCLTINFNLPTTPAQINLASPLSTILVPLSINGTTGGVDPLITVKGNGSFNGFNFGMDGASLNNLGLSGFKNAINMTGDYNAINTVAITQTAQPIAIAGSYNQVFSSAINTLFSAPTTTMVDTLVYITGTNNQIGKLNQPNTIINGSLYGVLVNGGKQNSILYNAIYDNSTAIAHVNNGNNLYPVPTNMVGTTLAGVSSVTGKANPNDKVQVFISSYEPQQAYRFAVEVTADAAGNWTVIVPANLLVPNQNNFVVTTATDVLGNTSPLSPPVRIGNFVQRCYVTNTLNTGKGSLREAVNCANIAGSGMGVPAQIIFQLPSSANEILINSGMTITNNYGVKINPYSIPVSIKAQAPSFSGFTWGTNSLEIKNLTFENFATALNCAGTNAVIDSNEFVNDALGILVNAPSSSVSQQITRNFFAGGGAAILSQRGALLISENTIGAKKNGTVLGLSEFGVSLTNASTLDIRKNKIQHIGPSISVLTPAAYKNVPLYIKDAQASLIDNTLNGIGSSTPYALRLVNTSSSLLTNNAIGKASTGVRIEDANGIQCITNNLSDVSLRGFDAWRSDNIKMVRNTIQNLQAVAKPIDLHLNTADKSNNNITTPTILSAKFHDGLLFLVGESDPLNTIELFYSDVTGNDLDQYVLMINSDSAGIWTTSLPITAANAKNYFFKATATYLNRTSEASLVFNPNLSICLVTTNNNTGNGSLRDAIEKANNNTCNLIQFDIVGSTTIEPSSDLPLISAVQLIIDATSQPGYSKGNPTIELLDNAAQNYAFSTRGTIDFNVYGIKISGYDTSIAVTGAKLAELNDNALNGFIKSGIAVKSNVFVLGTIASNQITSTGETGILILGPKNLIVNENSINGISQHGIYMQGVNNRITTNTIKGGNINSAVGISLQNASDMYLDKNNINKVYRGIRVIQGQRHALDNNIIGSVLPADISAGNVVNESGIFVDQTSRTRMFRNTVHGGIHAVLVQNSRHALVQNTKTKKTLNRVISIINTDSSTVNFNTLDTVNTGIYIAGSRKTFIAANTISHIKDYGIFLDTGADSSLIQENIIGADFIGSREYSEGEGIHIKGSDNLIGNIKDDSALVNTIFHNKKGGVIVESGTGNRITYNVFFENDISIGRPAYFAIAHKSGGNTMKAKPTITDHKYMNGKLYLYGNGAIANDSVHVYIGNGGYEEARYFMGSGLAVTGGNWEAIIDTAAKVGPKSKVKKIKPQTTLYFVATATDTDQNTSPLSNMYIIGDCYVTSLRDTTDNEYPMPNSLRMAVNCANGQKNRVGVYFKVDKFGAKEVALQMKLQPIRNSYGVNFNARNLITDSLRAGIDGFKVPAADDTLWVIAKTQGPSVFDSLEVRRAKNGILVMADSIVVNGFKFSELSARGLATSADADKLIVSASQFLGPQTGIDLQPGTKEVRLLNNEFGSLQLAIRSEGNDSLRVENNTFGRVGNDTLAVQTGLSLKNEHVSAIANNVFISRIAAHKAVLWDNTKGSLTGNRFSCRKALAPVEILSSQNVRIENNIFADSSEVYLTLNNTQRTSILSNTFQRSNSNSVKVTNSQRIQIKENNVARVVQDAFDINLSQQVFISRNTVTNVRYVKPPLDSALCINIHEGDVAREANLGKPRPFDLGYSVKKGSDGRRGLFVQGKAEVGDSIEVFFSDSLSASMNKYLITAKADANGLWEARIPRTEYHKDTTTWYHVIAVAIRADSNTSKTSSVLHIPPVFDVFFVRNDYDSGANSLRDALLQVNSSDLFSKVKFQIDFPQFQPGPYHIKLDSLMDPVYSYLGFVKDGKTQIGKGAGPDQRIIVESAKVGDAYALDITDSSDACLLSNMWFNDAKKGVRIENHKNTISNYYFITSSASAVQDTAFVVTGDENKIRGLQISNYKAGLVLTEGAGKNNISKSRIDSTAIAIIASDSAYKNIVRQFDIYNSSDVAILADSAAGDNVFTKNKIGAPNKAAIGQAIRVNNSTGQSFTYNTMAVVDPYSDARLSSAVVVTGNSSANYFFANKVGVDSATVNVHQANIRAFTIMPSVDGAPHDNTILGNEMSGVGHVAIYAYGSEGDLIAENLIGTDTLRNAHGMDSTAIYIKNCMNMEASDNVIEGYIIDGINLISSDNVRMNRNIIHSRMTNTKAININAGTPEQSNNGLVIPIITQGILVDTQTVRISGTAKPGIAVEVYESVKDTIQSVAYINKVIAQSNSTGDWTVDVPTKYFSFAKNNCFVAQNHEGARSSEFSASYRVTPLLCQLANSNPAIKLLEPLYRPCPGPDFVLDGGLDEGLTYKWKSTVWSDTLRTKKIKIQEDAPTLVLNITDNFGCSLTRTTNVDFKPRPINPDFIVSSEVFAGDTIVLVDVSLPVPTEYTWLSSAGVTVLSSGSSDNFIGDDGNVYPKGTRFIEFILPDSGSYTITQKSLRDGCFVQLSKELLAGPKNPNDKNPYFVAPEIQSLSAYPNPSSGRGVQAVLRTAGRGNVTLFLASSDGTIVWTTELSGRTNYKLTLPDILSPGVYYLRVDTGSKDIAFKLVVN